MIRLYIAAFVTLLAGGALIFGSIERYNLISHVFPDPVETLSEEEIDPEILTEAVEEALEDIERELALLENTPLPDAPLMESSLEAESAVVSPPSEPLPEVENTISTQEETVISDPQEGTLVARPILERSHPPLNLELVNALSRDALVNILCMPQAGSFSAISGSGVIIDSSGTILTNAHVAQYFLFQNDPRVEMNCLIRTGAPAQPTYTAELLYLPSKWIDEHAADIAIDRPLGTGEHDWALIRITGRVGTNLAPLPIFQPTIPDTRETAIFTDDEAIVASYPAGFLGGLTAQRSLYPASTVTAIGELFTFKDGSVDLLSLGGVIVAQGGSSGGAVVDSWNRLVALVVTSSDGDTTAERDLRAITLAHIDRSMVAHTGQTLFSFLAQDLAAEAQNFNRTIAPGLTQQLIDELSQ